MPTRNNNKPQKINMRATTSQYEIQVAKITFAQPKPLHFFSNISNSLLLIVNIKLISERRQETSLLAKTIAILYMMFRNRVTKPCPN